MKTRGRFGRVLFLTAISAIALLGCNEIDKFKSRMKITDKQVNTVQPILEEYLQKQDKLFDEIKSEMASRGPGGPGRGPGGGGEYGRPMADKRKEIDRKFEANDAWAMKELTPLVTGEQLAEFPSIAEEIRSEKKKEMMKSGPGGGMGRDREMGGGPPNGGPQRGGGPRGGY